MQARSFNAAIIALATLAVAEPADAGFPGRNGLISVTASGSIVGYAPGGGSRSVFSVSEDLGPASWAADGTRLAASQAGAGIVVGNWGGEPRLVVREGSGFTATRVSWSPDGRRLVYSRGSRDAPASAPLVVVAAGGGASQAVTGGEALDTDPDWSPRGDRIAFARWRPGGPGSGIYTVPAGGGPASSLISEADLGIEPSSSIPPVEWPTWSPDGSALAFVARPTGASEIFVSSLAGGAPRRLTAGRHPSWPPDGSLIAYVAGRDELRVIGTDGKGDRRVAQVEAEATSWQPIGGSRVRITSARPVESVVWSPPSEQQLRGRRSLGGRWGTDVLLRVSGSAPVLDVRATLERLVPGVSRGGRCALARSAPPGGRRCTVARRLRPRTHDVLGADIVGGRAAYTFDAAWGDRPLPAGRYRLTLHPLDADGTGAARSVIVRVAWSCLKAKRCYLD